MEKYKTKVYAADAEGLNDPELYAFLYEMMPAERKAKINKNLREENKRQSLLAGALLLYALSEAGIDEKEPVVTTGKNGKPYLADYPHLYYNLSHSGSKVMCVISGCEVGCDVEEIRRARIKIADHFFFREEYEHIVNAGSNEEKELFIRYWTLKESFMKVTGLGFSLPLRAFRIVFRDGKAEVIQSADDREFSFFEYDPDDGFRYALAVAEKAEERPEMEMLSLEKIKEKLNGRPPVI